MKTFTNCAEKKAKQFLNLLQGYTKGIRTTAILILLLMGVSNAWAGNNTTFQSGAYFYFDPYYDATNTVNKGHIQLAARVYYYRDYQDKDWQTAVTTLNKIENTRLYYTSTFEGPNWDGEGLSFHGWAMISNSQPKQNGGDEYWNNDNSEWYSDFKNYNLHDGSTYLFIAEGGNKGSYIQPSGAGYLSNGFSDLNSTQTIKTIVDGSEANSKAAITITSYEMTGNGTVTQRTTSISTSAKSTTISAARTATTTLSINSSVATGYDFEGWYTEKSGGTQLSSENSYTYYPTSETTVYARFKTSGSTTSSKIYLKPNSNWTADNARFAAYFFGNGEKWVSMVQESCDNQYYQCDIPAGYPNVIFCRMNPSTSANNWDNKWNQTNDLTVPANGNNLYTVKSGTWDKGGGTWSKLKATIEITPSDYGFINISPNVTEVDFGTEVTVTITPNNDYKVISYTVNTVATPVSQEGTITFTTTICSDTEISAEFKLSEIKYDVTISSAGNGTVEPSGTHKVGQNGLDIKATANNGYYFFTWASEGKVEVQAKDQASTKVIATGEGEVFAHFKETMHTINVKSNNDTYGTVTPASVTAGIATGSTNITATPETGYSFANWTADNGITIADVNSATTKVSTATTTGTVTANFQEKKHNVTVSYKCGTATIDDNTTNNVGEVTSTTITAPDIIGYTFKSWELESGINQKSVDGKSITITTKATGNYTLTAKYDEDLSTEWSLAHSIDNFNTSLHKFTKNTGESAGKVAYVSIDLAANTNYRFKVVNGSTWYGNNNNENNQETYWIKNTVEDWEFYNDAGDCHMKSSVAGTYTFKIDFSESNPKISVYFPTAYTVTYGIGNNKGTDAVTTDPTITSGDLVLASTSITFSKNATKAGYTWKNWNSKADGTGTILGTNNTYVSSNRTGDISVYACYDLIPYTITYYLDGGTNPNNAPTTYNVAAATTLPTPTRTGYTFEGWYDNVSLTGSPVSQIAKGSTEDKEFWAKWSKNSYTLTFGVQGGIGGNVRATVDGNAITSPATLEHGTQIAFTATADDKYKFSRWINGSTQISTETSFTHTLTADASIQAVFTNLSTLYLELNNYWKNDVNEGAWFAAYFYKNGSSDNYWVKMKNENPCGGSDYYKVQIPDGNWTNVIFCRMSKECHDLKWDCRWDQTQNLTIPTDGKNLFTIDKDEQGGDGGNNSGAKGSWSTHAPQNYEPVVFNVTVPANTPNCYIIGEWDGWSQFTEMTKVDDTHYTVSIPDACDTHKYKYCYGPSWGCEEVSSTSLPTTAIADRTYNNQDEVKAWIKYCLEGDNIGNWGSWNGDYVFDIYGDMKHNFNEGNYNFKVRSSIGKRYTNSHNNTYDLHRSHTSVKLLHEESEGYDNHLILQADLTGNYKFHFDPVSKLLTIEFPEKGYRLKITMTDGCGKVYTSNAVNNENETLSFFAPGANDPKLSGIITLEHEGRTISSFTAPTITESGVYTAKLNSAKNGITEIALYNGNYYIRTDGASGGWGNYTDNGNKMTYFVPREEEKYSYYWVEALPRASRNESNGVVNVKACVANEYNDNLAVMLGGDKFTSDSDGNVKIIDPDEHHREKINVRFGYNPNTNHFERAMLTGSGNINTFLNITDPEGRIYKTNNNGTLETQLIAASKDNKFTDISNWVYERDIWVEVPESEDVTVCLTAVSYNGARNSLFGFVDADQKVPTQRTIVGAGSTPVPKKMRVIYDFKTNRMIMAWMPGEYECKGDQVLNSDVLFLRHENELVPQLTLEQNAHITGIQSQFFALEFENKGNANYEEHYWFTLPFDCVVGSISGVPGYMQTWGIQRYNGKKRAEKGWWKETETFWEWLGPDDVMEAGVGYVLSFDKSAATWNTFDVHTENSDGSVTTTQRSLLRLYFPSTTEGFTFQSTNSFEKVYPNEPCTIQTADRYKQDGNWKIIGPISYNSATATPKYDSDNADNVWKPEKDSAHIDVPDVPEGKYSWSAPMFLYEYEYDNSTEVKRNNNWRYIVKSTINYPYQAFYGYMVQYAGTIEWNEISQSIHPRLRARTYTDQVPTNITTNLDLVDAEGVQHDQTFVSLDIEGTTTYDLNKDLNKVFNNNFANIYTLSENIPFAGNTLPMEKATVPVGVRIATAGEYTFRMPNGTEGISVILLDKQTGAQTNMLMEEYTVTLDAGTIENRFYLVVDPDRAATSVENVGEEAKDDKAKGVEKFLIDGKLFIRTADGIFDAKGQRL